MIQTRLQLLLFCLATLAGCRSHVCRSSSFCPAPRKPVFNRASPGWLSRAPGELPPGGPPLDADLAPTRFPEIFTASIGSSHAKFFPLPTQPIFPEPETLTRPAPGGETPSSPAQPEVIPAPPPLPPDDWGGTGTALPPIWSYEANRWQPAADDGAVIDRQLRDLLISADAPSSQPGGVSWVFQTPVQINSSGSTDAGARIVRSRTDAGTPISARRSTAVRR
ncbi:MAG: hypothetical protein ACUVQR_14040 [Thermogutta sp.]